MALKLLEKFEQSMESLIEGAAGSLFNQPLQPADIGRRLERAMEAGKVASIGAVIVPNHFFVGLNPDDFQKMQGYAGGIARQMEAHLAHEASERSYTMVSRIQVQIASDPGAKKRHPVVRATIVDAPHVPGTPPPSDPTSAFTPVGTEQSASLRGIRGKYQGRTFIVPPGVTTIGRSSTNDIVIECEDVSRRHARIDSASGKIRIEDLGSTNGTRVNGDSVRIADLAARDEIMFGGQRFSIEFHPSRNNRTR